MITRRIRAEEFKVCVSINCSANNLLIISQLGVLAEQFLIHILHISTMSVYLQIPTSLITPSN